MSSSNDDDINKNICTICIDKINSLLKTNCNHIYCSECIIKMIKYNNNNISCPLCRGEILNFIYINKINFNYSYTIDLYNKKNVINFNNKTYLKSIMEYILNILCFILAFLYSILFLLFFLYCFRVLFIFFIDSIITFTFNIITLSINSKLHLISFIYLSFSCFFFYNYITYNDHNILFFFQ